jgi:hypothetical protein
MKYFGYIILFFAIFFLLQIPVVLANDVHIDSVNGDNRNPGISSATPRKNGLEELSPGLNNSFFKGAETYRQKSVHRYRSSTAFTQPTSDLLRIILGSEIVSGWNEFSQTMWQAPLQMNANWSLKGLSVDDISFTNGCSADFLDDQQYYWESNMLYISDMDGNPDDGDKHITAQIYNLDTDEIITMDVTGWTAVMPSVWQAAFPTEPLHLFINDSLLDYPDCWWGPMYCEVETGESDYLYLRDRDGNPDSHSKTVAAVTNSGGWAVTSGDFNGDGLSDVVHSNSNGQVYINYGAVSFSPSPGQTLTDPDGRAGFGFFVASAGDVNNDGFDELIVAMDWNVGIVNLYMGSASGLSDTPSQQITAPDGFPAYGFGHGIADNGNINGDNYSDILILGGDASQTYLSVYLGSKEGIRSQPDSVVSFTDKVYGGSVCIIGDTNQDGFDEVALSMMTGVSPATNIDVLIYNGTDAGTLTNPAILQLVIPAKDVSVYAEVAPAGDVNADGFADLIVGNQWAQGDYENEGKAYIFLGSASGLSGTPDHTIDNPSPEFNVRFGNSVSGISDLDGDGYDDIAVGCPYHQENLGFVSIYSGSTEGISNTPSRTIDGVSQFGWSVAKAGDPDGSGKIYLIAGEEAGGAYLYAEPNLVGK